MTSWPHAALWRLLMGAAALQPTVPAPPSSFVPKGGERSAEVDFVNPVGADEPGDIVHATLPLGLDEAVALALRQNFDLRQAALQRVLDRFNLDLAYDKFRPHVALTAQVGPALAFGDAGEGSAWGGQLAVVPHAEWLLPTGTFLSADLTQQTLRSRGEPTESGSLVLGVAQPLFKNFGRERNRASVAIAEWQEGINRQTLRSAILEVAARVTFAYRDFSQAYQLRSIAQKAVERAQEVRDNNLQMVAAGRIARAELVQVDAGIATREANLASAEASFVGTQVVLLQLLALPPDMPVAPMPQGRLPTLPRGEQQARAVALQRRPDYVSSLLRQQLAERSVGVAHNARLWDFELVAQARRSSTQSRPLSLFTAPATPGNQSFFIGATLSVPLFHLNLEQQVVAANVALEQARVGVQAADNAVRQQVDGAMRVLRLQQRVYRLSATARRLSARTLENEQEKLSAGRSSTFVVLRFVDDLVNAEIAEIRAQINFFNAVTAVQLQTGTLVEDGA